MNHISLTLNRPMILFLATKYSFTLWEFNFPNIFFSFISYSRFVFWSAFLVSAIYPQLECTEKPEATPIPIHLSNLTSRYFEISHFGFFPNPFNMQFQFLRLLIDRLNYKFWNVETCMTYSLSQFLIDKPKLFDNFIIKQFWTRPWTPWGLLLIQTRPFGYVSERTFSMVLS